MKLQNKHILLGITGSIAAYKMPEFIRMLQNEGATVQVMVTQSALQFLTKVTLEAISGYPVLSDTFEEGKVMEHIYASRKADLIVVAPLTAHSLAKLAHGYADDIVSASILAAKIPVLLAPAMNKEMWANFLVQENIQKVQKAGYEILNPDEGVLACGEFGEGRLKQLPSILFKAIQLLTPQTLKGKKILVSGGSTREYFDPVRFFSNASSGKMSRSLVLDAYFRGAQLTFVHGYGDFAQLPDGIQQISVQNTEEMAQAVLKIIDRFDIYVSAAALADYSPLKKAHYKIKKQQKDLNLSLRPTTDLLSALSKRKKRPFIVGFALESNDFLRNAKQKMTQKKLDVVVLNTPAALEKNKAKVTLLSKKTVSHLPMLSKADIASAIFSFIEELL